MNFSTDEQGSQHADGKDKPSLPLSHYISWSELLRKTFDLPINYRCGLGILAGTSQTQYAAASARTSRDQPLHGGIGQMVEGQLLVLAFPRELSQVARDLPAHGTRQPRNVLVPGCGQRVEQHASIGLLREHAIHRDNVKMNIQIERRSKSLHDGQASGLQPTVQLALPGAAAKVGVDGTDECAKHHACGIGGIGHPESQGIGQRQDILPGRHLGGKVIHTESCCVGHTATKTAWAKPTSPAHERHDSAVPTVFAPDAKKAMGRNAATKVSLELVKHKGGQFAASRFQICQERRPVFLDRSEEQSRFGTMALVRDRARGRVGVTVCCRLRGKHQQELSATGRKQLLAEHRQGRRASRHCWRTAFSTCANENSCRPTGGKVYR